MLSLMVTGRLIGPVLGTGALDGRGGLEATSDGLAWELRKGFRKRSGLVEWARITKWEAGLQRIGRDSASVAFVSYGPEKGFLGLVKAATPLGSASIRQLTADAVPYLPDGVVTTEW